MRIVESILGCINEKGGTRQFADFVEKLTKRDSNGKAALEAETTSIRAIWDAFVLHSVSVHEAVDSTAFAKATGSLINQSVISGYNEIKAIGDQLVTTIPSSTREETIVGLNDVGMPLEVGEGMPYSHVGFSEKYVKVKNRKWGRIIAITDETIRFDQTGMILKHAKDLGKKARLRRERNIIRTIIEATSGASYYPSGTGTTLYDNSTHSNLSSSTAFGTAGLESAVNKLMEFTDSESDPIYIPEPFIVLVPSELTFAAAQMWKSALDPETGEHGANVMKARFDILTSPFLTVADHWWIGSFADQFVYTEVYPLEVLSRYAGGDPDFYRDIKYEHKVRFYGGCGALDYKYVIQCEA